MNGKNVTPLTLKMEMKRELSDSENSKSETFDSGSSHVNDGSFFKMEKTDNAFRFQFDIEGKT